MLKKSKVSRRFYPLVHCVSKVTITDNTSSGMVKKLTEWSGELCNAKLVTNTGKGKWY